MEHRTAKERLYKRGKRWWADFRDFTDHGGEREPLRVGGSTRATMRRGEALLACNTRLNELVQRRNATLGSGPAGPARFRDFAAKYLELKAETDLDFATLERIERALEHAFKALVAADGTPLNPFLHQWSSRDGRVFLSALRKLPSRRGGTLSSRSIRAALDAVTDMYRYAAIEGHVPDSFNPLAKLPSKPRVVHKHADFMEPVEAAAFLEALCECAGGITAPVALSFFWALTGARPEEGKGVTLSDMDQNQNRVHLRENDHRDIKTGEKGERDVPLWPQLQAVLAAYLAENPRRSLDLLFPTISMEETEVMIHDVRKLYRSAQKLAIKYLDDAKVFHQLRDKHIVPRSWRTTYATSRAHTLDGGVPVSPFTIQHEMGHTSLKMLQTVYVRASRTKLHTECVEYRLPNGDLAGASVLRQILGSRTYLEVTGVSTYHSAPFFGILNTIRLLA